MSHTLLYLSWGILLMLSKIWKTYTNKACSHSLITLSLSHISSTMKKLSLSAAGNISAPLSYLSCLFGEEFNFGLSQRDTRLTLQEIGTVAETIPLAQSFMEQTVKIRLTYPPNSYPLFICPFKPFLTYLWYYLRGPSVLVLKLTTIKYWQSGHSVLC